MAGPVSNAPKGASVSAPAFAAGAGADNAFLTLRALLALKGYSLSLTHGDDGPVCFHVTRWGMVRELPHITAVRVFAEQVGVSHA